MLGFDADHEITLVTTADPGELHAHGREATAAELVGGSTPGTRAPRWHCSPAPIRVDRPPRG